MSLTEREQTELRAAVVEYIASCLDASTSNSVITALQQAPCPSDGALVKRWSIMRRLSAKNMELESQIRSLQQELAVAGSSPSNSTPASTSSPSSRPLIPFEVPQATLKGHRDTLTSVTIHPLEPLAISSSEDGTVVYWDLREFSILQSTRPHSDTTNQVAFEPLYGCWFATCSNDTTVKVFGERKKSMATQTSPTPMVGSYDCIRTLQGHHEPAFCIAWCQLDVTSSSGADAILSGSRDGEIRLWDVNKAITVAVFKSSAWVRSLSVPRLNRSTPCVTTTFASCGNDELVTVWDVATRQPVHVHHEHDNVVHAVALSHFYVDATLTEHRGTPAQRKQFDDARRATPQVGLQLSTAMLPNGQIIQATSSVKQATAPATSYSYNPMFVASGGRDKKIVITPLDDPSTPVCIFNMQHQNWVRALYFTNSGRHLISVADDGLIIVFDLISAKPVKRIVAHDHFVTCLAFPSFARDETFITGSADATLKVWRCV